MKKRVWLLTAAVCAATLASGCRHDSPEPWEKFVNARGQVWPTNGVCRHSHAGEKHIAKGDWQGGWIQVNRKQGSPDSAPVFTVKVAPGTADENDWDGLELTYVSGTDSSTTPFPICEGNNSDNSESAASGKEHLLGTIEALTHTNGSASARVEHTVRIYIWAPATDSDGNEYGPIQVIFWHDAGGSHNGIVH